MVLFADDTQSLGVVEAAAPPSDRGGGSKKRLLPKRSARSNGTIALRPVESRNLSLLLRTK